MVNYGLDMLADYAADQVTNAKPKANPAYITARKAKAAAKTALTKAETGLAELLADPTIPAAAKNSALIPAPSRRSEPAGRNLEAAEAERKKHRARLPADEIDPPATRAILHINRRCLQLTLRLLAANAEHYLARHLNAYLDRRRRVPGHHPGDDHPRARRNHHLRAQERHRDAGPARQAPRIARALALLLAEINTRPPILPGDGRPIGGYRGAFLPGWCCGRGFFTVLAERLAAPA